jgi:hypothetical protein
MMTIVTHVTLREGAEPEWDAAMRERLAAATDDWEVLHQDPAFAKKRQRIEGLEDGSSEQWWHEVLDLQHA